MTSFAARVARVLHVTLPDGAAMVERTTMIARVLYILGAAQLTGGWVGLRMHQDILLQPLTRPLPWKMWFLRSFETIDGLRMGVAAAGLLFLFGTIGAIVNPWWRPARIAFTLGLVASAGIRFAMNGKIDHPLHALMWATFVLVFLPPRALVEAEPAARRAMLHVLWCAHAMVLLLYSMAGFSKVTEGLLAFTRDAPSWLMPDGLVFVLMAEPRASETLVGPILIEATAVAYALQLSVVYLETFAIVAAFRPRLLRAWGLALASLHLGIVITMKIEFGPALTTILLLSAMTPFAVSSTAAAMLHDLPIVGRLLATLCLRKPRVALDVLWDPAAPRASAVGAWLARAPFRVPVVVRAATDDGQPDAGLDDEARRLVRERGLVVITTTGDDRILTSGLGALTWALALRSDGPFLLLLLLPARAIDAFLFICGKAPLSGADVPALRVGDPAP